MFIAGFGIYANWLKNLIMFFQIYVQEIVFIFFSQFSLKGNWIFRALVNLWLYLFWTEGMAILFLSNYFMWLQFEQSVDVTIIKSDIEVIFSNELAESFCFVFYIWSVVESFNAPHRPEYYGSSW
jgi:hypothetical protein